MNKREQTKKVLNDMEKTAAKLAEQKKVIDKHIKQFEESLRDDR